MKKAIHRLLILTAFLYIVVAKTQCMGTNIENEIWKSVVGYEGLYEVSNHGRVKSLQRTVNSPIKHNPSVTRKERILKQGINKLGYKSVVVQIIGQNKNQTKRVHRLVAESFIPNPSNYPIINHIDSNPSNNHIDNLEWCTQSHNILHAFKTGRKKAPEWFYKSEFGRNNPASRQVIQKTLLGEFVKEWDCVSYIERDLGFNRPNICKCCRGKIPTAYGFKWEYA